MSSIDEKRVYARNTDPETAIVASETGAANVSLAGGRVGRVSLRYRDAAADVAARDERALVATDAGVLDLAGEEPYTLGASNGDGNDTPSPASAVAIDDSGRALAASGEVVFRYEDGDGEGTWRRLGAAGEIRAIDGDLVASREGVFRIDEEGLRYSGLDDAFDVASAGTPHAATSEGLYALGNGWMAVLEGAFSTVTADPGTASTGTLGRAHAIGDIHVYEHVESDWQRRAIPIDERVVDVAYGEGTYAVTDDGTLLVDDGEDWRTHPLGLRGVRAFAVVSA